MPKRRVQNNAHPATAIVEATLSQILMAEKRQRFRATWTWLALDSRNTGKRNTPDNTWRLRDESKSHRAVADRFFTLSERAPAVPSWRPPVSASGNGSARAHKSTPQMSTTRPARSSYIPQMIRTRCDTIHSNLTAQQGPARGP